MLVLELVAFVLPLCLDSFAVAAAIGAAGPLPARDRWRLSALFVVFEAGMPLVGLAIGAPLAHAIGNVANYVAAAAIIGVGIWLLAHDDDDETQAAQRLISARGVAVVGLGIGISLDELAIGFGLGLTRLPVVPVVIAIACQAFLAVQLGLLAGSRMAERHREWAERLAAIVLILLGLLLLVEQVFGAKITSSSPLPVFSPLEITDRIRVAR